MTKTIRCKFSCASKREYRGYSDGQTNVPLYEYIFYAVTGGTDENKSFFASTPAGNFTCSGARPDWFVVGEEYYIDLSPAKVTT
jgi:hypothetical protein